MKKYIILLVLTFSTIFVNGTSLRAQTGDFGFGLILIEPLGATVKYWTASNQAIDADIGESYFGAPRVDVDYLWHFNSFNSHVALLYGGLGASFGFGYGYSYDIIYARDENGTPFYYRTVNNSFGFGVRMLFGLDIFPKRVPFEFFAQIGPLIGIVPVFGVGFDFAIGARFYP